VTPEEHILTSGKTTQALENVIVVWVNAILYFFGSAELATQTNYAVVVQLILWHRLYMCKDTRYGAEALLFGMSKLRVRTGVGFFLPLRHNQCARGYCVNVAVHFFYCQWVHVCVSWCLKLLSGNLHVAFHSLANANVLKYMWCSHSPSWCRVLPTMYLYAPHLLFSGFSPISPPLHFQLREPIYNTQFSTLKWICDSYCLQSPHWIGTKFSWISLVFTSENGFWLFVFLLYMHCFTCTLKTVFTHAAECSCMWWAFSRSKNRSFNILKE